MTRYHLGLIKSKLSELDSDNRIGFILEKELSRSEFDMFVQSIHVINTYISDSQLFNIVRWNYKDFSQTINNYLFTIDKKDGSFINEYPIDINLNRLFLNLLSSVRSYLDFMDRKLKLKYDALPDFIQFLEKRRILLERSLLLPLSSMLDFLAFYKTNPDLVDRAIDHNIHLMLVEGIWKNYRETLKDVIKHRDELNEPSYFIDNIIDFLHTSVGFSLPDNVPAEFGISGQGSLESYLTIARELASLPRLERRVLGERFLRCMKLADKKELSYSMVFNEKEASIILVLSMSGKRSKRQLRLIQLCALAYCYMNAKQIIGLASELYSEFRHSYDVIGLKDVRFENYDKLTEQAKIIFSKPYKPEINEYKGRIDSNA